MKATFYLKSGNTFSVHVKSLSFKESSLKKEWTWEKSGQVSIFKFDVDSVEAVTIKRSLWECFQVFIKRIWKK